MIDRIEYINQLRDNTTFIISGHNIKWVAVLAVESLIKRCGIKRENIVYFDDYSTDGTSEELNKRGIRIISWIPSIFRNFSRSSLKSDLCVRVDQIIRCAAKQEYDTKYICFLDGDMVYEQDAIGYYFNFFYDEYIKAEKTPDFVGILRVGRNPQRATEETITNITQNFLWCDIALANENELFENRLDELIIAQEKDPTGFAENYDTGGLVSKAIRMCTLNYICLENEQAEDMYTGLLARAYHFNWMASSMRKDDLFEGDWKEKYDTTIINMKNVLPPFCEEYGIPLDTIIAHYTNCIKQSPVCE